MERKRYYLERKGLVSDKIENLELMCASFYNFFRSLLNDYYFLQATGYECTDRGRIDGLFGDDVPTFIYVKTRLMDVWPIDRFYQSYDEPKLFTMIEFLYDYISKPLDLWYHSWNQCGWHATRYDKDEGKKIYRTEINTFLRNYKKGYELSEDGEIFEIPPSGFEAFITEPIKTDDPENIDKRLEYAKNRYLRYGSTLEDKKDAVRTLADILEYLRKCGIRLQNKDDDDLFNIINNFDIRHHNTSQQKGYDREIWYDWMFYTFLSSINVLLKLSGKYKINS